MSNMYDYVRAVAFLIVTIILSFRDVNTWFIVDCCMSVGFGLGLILAPSFDFNQFIDQGAVRNDGMHFFLFRQQGCLMLAGAALLFELRKSRERTVIKSLLWSRTVMIAVFTAHVVYARWQYPGMFTDKHMWYGMYGSVLWLLAQSIQHYRHGLDLPGKINSSKVNIYFKIDSICSAFLAVADVFVPFFVLGMMNTPTDKLHNHILSCVGAFNLGLAVMSWYAQTFRLNEDKRSVFCSRLTGLVTALGCIIYGRVFEGFCTNNFDLFLVSVGAIPMLVSNLVGLFVLKNRISSSQAGYNLRSKNN